MRVTLYLFFLAFSINTSAQCDLQLGYNPSSYTLDITINAWGGCGTPVGINTTVGISLFSGYDAPCMANFDSGSWPGWYNLPPTSIPISELYAGNTISIYLFDSFIFTLLPGLQGCWIETLNSNNCLYLLLLNINNSESLLLSGVNVFNPLYPDSTPENNIIFIGDPLLPCEGPVIPVPCEFIEGQTIVLPNDTIPGDTITLSTVFIPGDTITYDDVFLPGDTIAGETVMLPNDTVLGNTVYLPNDTITGEMVILPNDTLAGDTVTLPPTLILGDTIFGEVRTEYVFVDLDCLTMCDYTSVYAPNSVSPNGDGINDVWYILYDTNCFIYIDIQIYNRWGELIWMGENTEAWNPDTVAQGVYIYRLVIENVEVISGTIVVVY